MIKRTIKSFARRKGHITSGQAQALAQLSSQYIIPFKEEAIRYQDYLNEKESITMEIGFGMGKATALIAQNNPQKGYLGVEVYEAGVGKLLMEIENRGLANLKIINHDAVEVMDKMIEPASLDGVHVFFPDPWPKARHHKRRLLKPAFIRQISRCLKEGAYLYIVTDWENYAEEIMQHLQAETSLKNSYEGYADPQPWRPKTKFQEKGEEKSHHIFEFMFTKQ